MKANRVLLAHRDPAVQELATRALSRIGVAVDIADDRSDALLRIARDAYSVIALERDDTLLSAVASMSPNPRPVVIVTAPVAPGNHHALDPQVVSMVVPEPYDAQTLVGVILACVTPVVEPPAAPMGNEAESRQ